MVKRAKMKALAICYVVTFVIVLAGVLVFTMPHLTGNSEKKGQKDIKLSDLRITIYYSYAGHVSNITFVPQDIIGIISSYPLTFQKIVISSDTSEDLHVKAEIISANGITVNLAEKQGKEVMYSAKEILGLIDGILSYDTPNGIFSLTLTISGGNATHVITLSQFAFLKLRQGGVEDEWIGMNKDLSYSVGGGEQESVFGGDQR